jgi:hypothetical protein
MVTLDPYIPELPEDATGADAALAYGAAGLYVGPIDPRAPKNPGRVLGEGWQHKTTRDAEEIAALWFGSSYGVFIHLGRSGLVGVDIDDAARCRSKAQVVADALESAAGPFQSSRLDDPLRGHYILRTPPGRPLGNSRGRWDGCGFDIRGRNGIMVVQPTIHEKAAQGARYLWTRTGVIPVMPAAIADGLPDADEAAQTASDEQVMAFLSRYTSASRPTVLKAVEKMFREKAETGSRHNAMVSALAAAMKEARAGLYSAQDAYNVLIDLFIEHATRAPLGGERQRSRSQAQAEFDSIMGWAVAQANIADLDEVRRRVTAKVPKPTKANHGSAAFLSLAEPEDADGALKFEQQPEAFWQQRGSLKTIHRFAQSRRVGPWGTLAGVLVRVICHVPFWVRLPATIAGPLSLNLFAALVGESGSGKDACEAVARDCVEFGLPSDYGLDELPVGSGEGIAKALDGGKPALFTAPEVDSLEKLFARAGSTLEPELRKLYTGLGLGFMNADAKRRTIIPAHSYRAGLVVGVQPLRAGGLLSGADGGTPQRFIWSHVHDVFAPDSTPVEPAPLHLDMSELRERPDSGYLHLVVPEVAREAIQSHALRKLRREPVDPLDGHRMACRLKIAAALMFLENGGKSRDISVDDWNLAAEVMAVSDQARGEVEEAGRSKRKRDNESHAANIEERESMVVDRRTVRTKANIVRYLEKRLGTVCNRSEVRSSLKRDLRPYFDPAMVELHEQRVVMRAKTQRGEGFTLLPESMRGAAPK